MMTRSHTLCMTLLISAASASFAFAGNVSSQAAMPELLPPNPVPGECYARVKIPAQYRNDNETVIVEDGREVLEVTEPKIRARQEQVLVKEASVHYKVRQPVFRTVTENMVVRPAYEKLVATTPRMSMVKETIAVSKPRLVWKQGNPAALRAQGYVIHSTADAGIGGRGYRSTVDYGRSRMGAEPSLCGNSCQIWCLVEEPGESVSYNRKVLSSEASVTRVTVPAKVRAITKQIVSDPGGVEEIPIPAQYQSVTVEDIVGKSRVKRHAKPPVYGSVAKRVMVSAERYEWRRIACRPGQAAVRRGGVSYYTAPQTPAYSQGRHRVHTGTVRAHTRPAIVSSRSRTYGSHTYGTQAASSSYKNHAMVQTHAPVYAPAYTSEPQPVIDQVNYYDPSLPTYSEDYTKPEVTHPLHQYESKRKKRTKQRYRRWDED